MTTKKPATKKQTAQNLKNDAAVKKTAELTVDKTLASLATTQAHIGRTIAGIQEELVGKVTELEALTSTIDLKRQELEQLHGADQILLTIDELNQLHKQRKEDLEDEMMRAKRAWTEEQEETRKRQARDESDYLYKLNQTRQQEQNTYQETVRVRNNNERDRVEKLEKDLNDRVAAVVAKETEFTAMKAKVDSFEADMKKEVDRNVAIVGNSMKKDHNHEVAMLASTHKSEVAVLQTQLEALRGKVSDQGATITALETQLRAAVEASQSIAKEALSSASDKRALAEITSFAGRGNDNGTGQRRS